MTLGDITILQQASSQGGRGSRTYNVAAGATAIYAGEPVIRALGATSVTVMLTNSPVVATTYVAGIAETTSTHTASVAGTVQVYPTTNQTTWLIAPKVAASWDTQAEYDALVGYRVLIDLTSGVYTILVADGATYGCVIMPLDIGVYPGKVAFAFRNGCSDLA